jgi:hypothetical protein
MFSNNQQLNNKIIFNMVNNAMEHHVLPFLLKPPQSLPRRIQSLDLLSLLWLLITSTKSENIVLLLEVALKFMKHQELPWLYN